jgi:transcriptional regulator with XRE-family HTH domain
MTVQTIPAGAQIREWRTRRRMSQLDLALEADISTRHLSFVETGRSRPSVGMLGLLADRLDMPFRARNALFLAAGFAPRHDEHPLDDPGMADARRVIDHVLRGHEPYPAMAVDRHWNMIAANAAVGLLTEQIAPAWLTPPVNVIRLALHPDGLAPQIVNFGEWRAHILDRLDRQVALTADPGLAALREEVAAYPCASANDAQGLPGHALAVPLIVDTVLGRASFITTITVFGTPVDVTLSELAIEAFFPADAETARLLGTALAG